MIYYAIVEKDPDSAYGVTFPDLPGCFSAADEENDILSEAQTALSLYASDETELPAPRDLYGVRRDPDVAAALSAGGFIIGVPLAIADKKVRINAMFDRGLLELVDQQVKIMRTTRSDWLASAAEIQLTKAGSVLVKRTAGGVQYTRKGGSGKSATPQGKSVRSERKRARA